MSLHKTLPRRTLLKGLGTALAVPWLDAMAPVHASAGRQTPSAPRRMAFVYVPNGIEMDSWTPREVGDQFRLPATLEPLAAHQDSLLLLSGLAHHNANELGDGPGGSHPRAAACFLTGVHPRKTLGADIRGGVSVDQIAAQQLIRQTKFSSLELGCDRGRLAGECVPGYSCAYTNNLSWRTPTSPLPPEINPRLLFERMFGTSDLRESAENRGRRQRYNQSILDFVQEDTNRLKGDLGVSDRRKLDEYLHAVRDIEQRLTASSTGTDERTPPIDRPVGIPEDFGEHIRLMFDLLALAFQSDLTRIATFIIARETSTRSYPMIGVPEGHHALTHHGGNENKQEKVKKINRFHMEQFARFVDRLSSVQEADGTVLDNSVILYGAGISDGNAHLHNNLPVLLAGRSGGALRSGRHIRYADETPMANLYLSMLAQMGVHMETLGDATGRLDYLSGI